MPGPASHTGLTSPPSASPLLVLLALQQRSCLTEFVAGMSLMPTSPRGRLILWVFRRLSLSIMRGVAEQFVCRQLTDFGW